MAGTVTYVDLSDASRAVIASLQPVAFLSFIQTIAADRPSIYRCYSSNAVTAPASITVSAVDALASRAVVIMILS